MDPESKDLLRQQIELLKKINRHFAYQRVFGILKNLIIIGFIVFGAIQLQPYLDSLLGVFSQIQGLGENGPSIQDFLK